MTSAHPQTWVLPRIPLPLSTHATLVVDLLANMVPDISTRSPSWTSRRGHHGLAYGVVGITQAMAGLFVYVVIDIMASYGW